MILFLKSFLQVVVHGFMESDSYSPLLNISVIPQVTYRLVILNTPYISPHTIQTLISHLTQSNPLFISHLTQSNPLYLTSHNPNPLYLISHQSIFSDLSITFHPLGTSHLEENVQLWSGEFNFKSRSPLLLFIDSLLCVGRFTPSTYIPF